MCHAKMRGRCLSRRDKAAEMAMGPSSSGSDLPQSRAQRKPQQAGEGHPGSGLVAKETKGGAKADGGRCAM